jgi:hypothetical protein
MATLEKLARFSTVHQVCRLLTPNSLIDLAISDSSKVNRRLLDASPLNTRKRKRFLQPAGLRCPTILCEIEIIFADFYFFRKISLHSLVGLENGAMLLLGGKDESSADQTGIWELKEDRWNRIGELLKV